MTTEKDLDHSWETTIEEYGRCNALEGGDTEQNRAHKHSHTSDNAVSYIVFKTDHNLWAAERPIVIIPIRIFEMCTQSKKCFFNEENF